jgi:hypothetical protein
MALATGCGINADDSPRPIAIENLPEDLQPTETTEALPRQPVPHDFYFADAAEGELRVSTGEIQQGSSLAEVLDAMRLHEIDAGALTNFVNVPATVVSSDGVATVTFEDDVELQGELLTFFRGQILFTLQALDSGPTAVEIFVNGDRSVTQDGPLTKDTPEMCGIDPAVPNHDVCVPETSAIPTTVPSPETTVTSEDN